MLLDRGKVVSAGRPADVLTPEVLEPVYGVAVRTLSEPTCVLLIFQLPDRGTAHDIRGEPEREQIGRIR